jgi:hypothetical protein
MRCSSFHYATRDSSVSLYTFNLGQIIWSKVLAPGHRSARRANQDRLRIDIDCGFPQPSRMRVRLLATSISTSSPPGAVCAWLGTGGLAFHRASLCQGCPAELRACESR